MSLSDNILQLNVKYDVARYALKSEHQVVIEFGYVDPNEVNNRFCITVKVKKQNL